jgi:hypothetical protein
MSLLLCRHNPKSNHNGCEKDDCLTCNESIIDKIDEVKHQSIERLFGSCSESLVLAGKEGESYMDAGSPPQPEEKIQRTMPKDRAPASPKTWRSGQMGHHLLRFRLFLLRPEAESLRGKCWTITPFVLLGGWDSYIWGMEKW